MSNEFYAYSKEWAMIETVMRFQAVKRWHMIDTTRQQTLAEHSANVAALAYLVCVTCPGAYFATAECTIGALFHDMPEVFTGDIPSPSKKYLDGVVELEFKVLPDVAAVPIQELKSEKLIKLCDLADGIRFIRLHGVDITATHAKTGLEKKFATLINECSKEWPAEVVKHINSNLTFYIYEQS